LRKLLLELTIFLQESLKLLANLTKQFFALAEIFPLYASNSACCFSFFCWEASR